MATPPLSDEKKLETLRLWSEYGTAEAARRLKISESTVLYDANPYLMSEYARDIEKALIAGGWA